MREFVDAAAKDERDGDDAEDAELARAEVHAVLVPVFVKTCA